MSRPLAATFIGQIFSALCGSLFLLGAGQEPVHIIFEVGLVGLRAGRGRCCSLFAALYHLSSLFRAVTKRWIIRASAIAPPIPSNKRSDVVKSIPKIVITRSLYHNRLICQTIGRTVSLIPSHPRYFSDSGIINLKRYVNTTYQKIKTLFQFRDQKSYPA